MTMISALITKGVVTDDAVYLACDSRVNFSSDSSGKHEAFTDEADKVRIINESLVIAYAGDYYRANKAIDKINKDTAKNSSLNIYDIAMDITNKLHENFTGMSTSFLVCIKQDHWNVYEINSETFIPQPKSIGLHLIGMGEKEQEVFRNAFEKAREDTVPPTIDGYHTISLLSAYQQSFSKDINGVISFYILKNSGITRNGIAVNNDQENWVAYSPGKNGTTRFINGKPFGSTKSDYKKIKDGSKSYYNDIRKFLGKR